MLGRERAGGVGRLIVSKPCFGLECSGVAAVRDGLAAAGGGGAAVLLISEDLDEVMELSDRIIVLLEGEIMGEVARADFNVNDIGLLMSGVTATSPLSPS